MTDASNLPDIFQLIFQQINICADISGHKYNDPECNGPGGSDTGLGGVDIVLKQNGNEIAQRSRAPVARMSSAILRRESIRSART